MKLVNTNLKAPIMLRQMVLQLPVDTIFELLDVELQTDLIKAGVLPGAIIYGSQPFNGDNILLILANVDQDGLQTIIDTHSLTWEVLASEHENFDESEILKFMKEVEVFDEFGNSLGFVPLTSLTDKLHTFAGHEWNY